MRVPAKALEGDDERQPSFIIEASQKETIAILDEMTRNNRKNVKGSVNGAIPNR